MFGFRGGEELAVIARKREYLKEAQVRWPFLTHFDATTIRNEKQLATMVKERCSLSPEEADADVAEWAKGKRF
jgi:hypothetical protein